jgi:hypothetical protein
LRTVQNQRRADEEDLEVLKELPKSKVSLSDFPPLRPESDGELIVDLGDRTRLGL